MSKQHIVIVYEDASGKLQVTPDHLEVHFGDTVMFFSEDHELAVDFAIDDSPFDHFFFDIPAANYMAPEPVTEQNALGNTHHYLITAFNLKRQLSQQIDPIIIVDPYPLEDKIKGIRSKLKERK